MKRYILNLAVITTEGLYEYKLLSVEEAKDWLSKGEFESTIGNLETALAFYEVFGIQVDISRKLVKMEQGDEALVFKINCRLEDVGLKVKISEDFVLKNLEIGLLKKLK